MVTIPLSVALAVVIVAELALAGDALCVAVSAKRALKLYAVFGVSPLKVVEVCHAPEGAMRYSQPVMVASVMLVAVGVPNTVGAAGAAGVALITTVVAGEVIPPV